ncbi:FAD-dependent oxidoreductase [Acidianus manzaensis]|uniref:FAD-dependent oxidoreductase n=1 Tax=Acidianus manzaensis TaxID=282676 RepID=A0A1W6JXE8_9CREN|nr:FAD-binding oxidoreductase [Acidianus manzaensis]ARM74925.1 FAD-dependent oxidoreductase [Acidianus manzaensis]
MKIAIIGSGIAGSSLYHLFKKSNDEVIVIDPRKRRIFPSLIHSLLLVDDDVLLAKKSLEFYREFNIPLKEYPSFTIGKIDKRLLDEWTEAGARIEEKYINWLNTEGIYAENGDRLVYINTMINNVPIIKMPAKITEKENKAIVTVNGKEISADLFILSAGPWNNELFNVKTKSYYCWASLSITEHAKLDKMFIYDYELNFYSRPFLGLGINTAIIGDGAIIEAKPGTKLKVDPYEVLNRAKKRLGNVTPIYTSGEFCEGTPDMRPMYGRILDNLYFVGGFNGYGAEVGPGVAKLLYEFIKSGKENRKYMLDRFKNVKDFSLGKEPHEL